MPTKLTPENYYSHDTDWEYMSFSLFKDFQRCEAAALAKLKGDWTPELDAKPLLVGNYVHSYFESPEAHEKFVKDHKSKIMSTRGKTKGQLKADYKFADVMIKALDDSELFNYVYKPGRKEVIVTGKLFGYDWKGKIDSLILDQNYFCDLKTVDDLHKKHWQEDSRSWDNFIEDRGYYMQMAIYRELIKQTFGKDCNPYMFAVSKQAIPDKLAIDFTGESEALRMQAALEEIEANQERYWNIMMGEIKPKPCGRCEYCRSHKVLEEFVHATDIEVY